MVSMICIGDCVACGVVFGFNPHKVPSLRTKPDGPRKPVCLSCIERANPIRIANGLPPLVPLPGAYEPETSEDDIAEGRLDL